MRSYLSQCFIIIEYKIDNLRKTTLIYFIPQWYLMDELIYESTRVHSSLGNGFIGRWHDRYWAVVPHLVDHPARFASGGSLCSTQNTCRCSAGWRRNRSRWCRAWAPGSGWFPGPCPSCGHRTKQQSVTLRWLHGTKGFLGHLIDVIISPMQVSI